MGDGAVKLKVTYTGQLCGPDGPASYTTTTRPITFRSWSIIADLGEDVREGFGLFRRRGGSELPWEPCDLHDCEGFQIYDAPDVAVSVTEHQDFTTLRPGESWTTTKYIDGQTSSWNDIPVDTAVGDVFLFGFRGAFVEWWDWGGAEEHADTVVMLPCWLAGRVVDPRDNGGRPKLIVPHTEPVEFRVVE
jgi:hypothetical protein